MSLCVYKVKWYNTRAENKYQGTCCEYLCSREDAWDLWYALFSVGKFPHVEIYHGDGTKCSPEKGWREM